MMFSRSVSIIGFLAVIAPFSAMAQNDGIPDIVITPTKTARPVDEIPYAVTRINAHIIDKDQPQSIDDIFKDIPNIEGAGGPRISNEEPNLRGLSDRRIVIKIDGIRRNFRAQHNGRYFIDTRLIENAEIVRGANSTIDGSGAIGGVIQFFTPDVKTNLRGKEFPAGARLQAGYQSVNSDYSALASTYMAKNNIDVFGALSMREYGSMRTGTGDTLSPGDGSPRNYLAKAGYSLTPSSRAEIRVASYSEKSEMPVNPVQPLSASNAATSRKSSVKDYSFRQSIKPEDGTSPWIDAAVILYRSEYDIDTQRWSDGRFDETDFLTNGLDINNTSRFTIHGVSNALTYGVEYFENEQNGKRNGATRSLLGEGKDKNLGIYAQNEIGLWDNRLTLTPGIRFDSYHVTPGNAALAKNKSTEFSPKLGINYKFNDTWSTYASVAKAFRAPTLTELYASGVMYPGNNLLANPDLSPEVALDKEVGLRFKTKDLIVATDRAKITLSLFHNVVDDYIEEVSTPTTTESRNVDQATLMGFEVEGKYVLNDTTLRTSMGYVRGENDVEHAPLSDVPSARAVVGIEKFIPSTSLTFGAQATYYAPQTRVPPEQALIYSSSAATIMGIYASWAPFDGRLNGLEVRVGVDNLLDTNYRRYLSFLPEGGRNIKADISWKF